LFIDDYSFTANLKVLPLVHFDVILGMDWLSSNDVEIQYAMRTVSLMTQSGKRVEYTAKKSASEVCCANHLDGRTIVEKVCSLEALIPLYHSNLEDDIHFKWGRFVTP